MRPLPPSCQPGLDAWNLFVIKPGNDRVAREPSCDLRGLSGWGPSLGRYHRGAGVLSGWGSSLCGCHFRAGVLSGLGSSWGGGPFGVRVSSGWGPSLGGCHLMVGALLRWGSSRSGGLGSREARAAPDLAPPGLGRREPGPGVPLLWGESWGQSPLTFWDP